MIFSYSWKLAHNTFCNFENLITEKFAIKNHDVIHGNEIELDKKLNYANLIFPPSLILYRYIQNCQFFENAKISAGSFYRQI